MAYGLAPVEVVDEHRLLWFYMLNVDLHKRLRQYVGQYLSVDGPLAHFVATGSLRLF